MKSFLPTFIAVLLAAGLALFVYDRYVLAPRMAKAGEAARVSLVEAREEAKGIASELDASVERSVAGAKTAFDKQAQTEDARRAELERQGEEMRGKAQVADALSRASMMKVAIAEYYMSMGEWPSKLSDLGMGKPSDFEGGTVEAITIEPEGVVAVSMKPEFAPGGKLRLVPRATPAGMINWSCRVFDYAAAETITGCKR